MPIDLEILTPSKRLVKTTVNEVYLPGVEGEIGILPDHAPMVTTLQAGIVKFENQRLAVRSGFARVQENKVTVLADEAVWPNEVKPNEIEAQRVEAEKKLTDPNLTPEEREKAAEELLWVDARGEAQKGSTG